MQYEYILSGFYQISRDLGEDGTLEDILGRKPQHAWSHPKVPLPLIKNG